MRVDWTCHQHYGDAVEVELHIMGERVRFLRKFSTPPRAIDWALRYMSDRGVSPAITRYEDGQTYVVLHALPRREEGPT